MTTDLKNIKFKLDLYEDLLVADLKSCEDLNDEPDDFGCRNMDDEKYDALCCDNPNENRYKELWTDIRSELISTWNNLSDEEKLEQVELLGYILSKIEEIHHCHAEPFNFVTTCEDVGPEQVCLSEVLESTPDIIIKDVFRTFGGFCKMCISIHYRHPLYGSWESAKQEFFW